MAAENVRVRKSDKENLLTEIYSGLIQRQIDLFKNATKTNLLSYELYC
jgi:hypothetical protein